MTSSLKALAEPENHDNLLLAEAAAWLHDFWKCTAEHIEYEASDRTANSTAYRTKYLDRLGPHQITLLGEGPVPLQTLIKDYILKTLDKDYIGETNELWLSRTLK